MNGIMGQVQNKGRVTPRQDGFTPKKRRRFYKFLRKTGCFTDAARKAGVSRETAQRWRRKDKRFAAACERALEVASADLEALAYERAVYGAEEVTIRNGEIVEVKRKPSDAMLRLLLIGSNRKKYGYAGAAQRKAIEKELRAKILEEMATEQPSIEDVRDEVLARLEAIRSHEQSQGKHVLAPWGGLVPPGYRITWEGEGEEPGAGGSAG